MVGDGGTILRTTNAGVTFVEQYPSVNPNTLELLQNYPNPFNPSTKIRFVLPKSDHVTLKVFNLLGQEIETLVDAVHIAGEYEVEWNAKGLASGVYIYRLQAGEFVETKKLVLLK